MQLGAAAPTRVLILGGSSEATALAHALAPRADIAATLSLAGRTVTPMDQPIPTRRGGFGGIDGLVAYLLAEQVDILVDATHPFAAHMAENARHAAAEVACRLIKVSRQAWAAIPGDRWREVATIEAAVAAIGAVPRRVFLTVGSLNLQAFGAALQHHYLVRTIDPVAADHALVQATFVTARGPFAIAEEIRLMQDHRIEILVTKNSGGDAAVAKLVAARTLGIEVILVRRPDAGIAVCNVAEAIAAIAAHRATVPRGV